MKGNVYESFKAISIGIFVSTYKYVQIRHSLTTKENLNLVSLKSETKRIKYVDCLFEMYRQIVYV